jgi:two-component system sensor histidine kinase/response regulator
VDSIGGGTPTPPLDLAQQVLSRPDLRASLIMMLTFAGHRRDAERCKALGVASDLLKSIRQSELREAIARILGANEPQGAIPLVTRYSLRVARDTEEVLSVLLAEGNLVNQRLSTRLLEKRGHHVKVVHNGREALETLDGTTLTWS